jgi:hypothetical protein
MNMTTPALGTTFEGGIFVGLINVNGNRKGILLPPKSIRQYPESIVWNDSLNTVEDAVSFYDGHSNTVAMAKAGSRLAQWALDHNMHIPSMDELDIGYRGTKPTKNKNALYNRSGINVSAIPPTYPYTADNPQQTILEQFREGGPEAFDTHDWYWSSTQHPGTSGSACAQGFEDGDQHFILKVYECLGCAVRWIDI